MFYVSRWFKQNRNQLKFKSMKTSKFSIVLIFLAVALLASGKDDKKKNVSGGTPEPTEGVVYALPQTGIRIHVKATRERYVHGPFQMYAQKMLGIDNAPSADADRWNLDEMKLEEIGRAHV